jgi:hypothetical protein
MGCCILGAIIFGFLLRSWRALQGVLGLGRRDQERPNAAMWRPGMPASLPINAAPAPTYYSTVIGLALILMLGYGAYSGELHSFHGWLGSEAFYFSVKLGVPADWALPSDLPRRLYQVQRGGLMEPRKDIGARAATAMGRDQFA